MPSLAFFDLDRTLTSHNVGAAWVRTERRAGRLRVRDALRYSQWLAGYALGVLVSEDLMRCAIGTLRGVPERELRDRTRAFYTEHVRGRYRPGALAAVEHHRAAGDALVLLTSASQWLADCVGDELAFDHVYACRYQVDDQGALTGAPEGTLCVGDGKRTCAEQLAEARGVNLDTCAFYTDSIADLPALEAVGRPVAVHPDRKLARTARERGWQVEHWDA